MKRLIRGVALALALPVSTVYAGGCFDFCDDYFAELKHILDGPEYFAEGAFLYWTHSDCEFAYAVRIEKLLQQAPVAPPAATVDLSSGSLQYVQPDLGPGFRVGFGFRRPDMFDLFMKVNYQYVDISSRGVSKIENNSAFDQIGILSFQFNTAYSLGANNLTGEVKSTYQKAEFQVGGSFAGGAWGRLQGIVNMMFVDIDHNRNSTGFFPQLNNGTLLGINQKHGFTGGGAGGRAVFDMNIGCGFTMWAEASAFALWGKQSFNRKGVASGIDANFAPFPYFNEVVIPSRTCPVVGFFSGLGAKYGKDCGCFKPALKIAFEYEHFVDILGYRVGLQSLTPPPSEDVFFGSLAYGGLTIEANVGF